MGFVTAGAATADRDVCRRILREGSRSFFAASLLLPPRVRDDASAVYAWCRAGDHAIDRSAEPAAALDRLRQGLDRTYAGEPEGPIERAFAGAVARHGIPRSVPDAMLEGFEWDVSGRTYETRDDLIEYCVRVGSTVGLMMSLVMSQSRPETLRSACRLGVAMQLTNIARDVGEDARAGRLYLPRGPLLDAGVDPREWMAAPAPSPGVRHVVRSLIDEADGLYASAWPGIADLPARCRPAIRAAAVVYAEIGRRVRDSDYDSVSARVWTTKAGKLRLLARAGAGLQGAWRQSVGTGPDSTGVASADRSAAFLVASVAREASVEHGVSHGLP